MPQYDTIGRGVLLRGRVLLTRYDDALPVQSAELNAPDELCEDTFLQSTLIVQATVPPLQPRVAITL